MNMMIKISFTGDTMCPEPMLKAYATETGHDFTPAFAKIKPVFDETDFLVVNLETPIAGKELDYVNERYRFNSPSAFAAAVKDLGADLVTLANNHCMDRDVIGIVNTLDNCKKVGLDAIGIYKTEADSRDIYVKEIGGIRIAFLNYTYGTNAFSHKLYLPEDKQYMVHLTQAEELLPGSIHLLQTEEEIAEQEKALYHPPTELTKPYLDRMKEDIRRAKEMADLVIFCLHCGGQYNPEPEAYTKMLCKHIKDSGADLIVGMHPHLIQSCETEDDMTTVYCLGNFMFSPRTDKDRPLPCDIAYSAILHAYIDPESKKLEKLSFHLAYVQEDEEHHTCIRDTAELFAENPDEDLKEEILYYVNRFIGKDIYSGIQKEYTLWEK